MISYQNNKGNKVNIIIRRHAVFAMQTRYKTLYKIELSLREAEHKIVILFPMASRVTNLNSKEKLRVKRHGHTIYFRDQDFTYIIHNGFMKSVEISRKGLRGLN